MARFLDICGPRGGRDFGRIFGFVGFGSRFRLVDRGDNSPHPSGAFGCMGNSSGACRRPNFSTFMVHMLVGFLIDFSIFGILMSESKFRSGGQGYHSQHLFDAFGRLGNSSGSYP